MGNAKPILGYPSVTAACVALHAQGLSEREIAKRVGRPQATVAALLISAKRTQDGLVLRKKLPRAVVEALKPHAVKRNVGLSTLAVMLLEAIAEGDLVDAVLDDADEAGGEG